jgi:hypothetical protein
VAYYALEENTDPRLDSTANHHDAAVVGTPTRVTGKINFGLQGAFNSYVRAADHADFRLGTTALTVAVWFNDPGTSADYVLFGKWNTGAGDREYVLEVASRRTYWFVRTGDDTSNVSVVNDFDITLNVWNFLVAWVDFGVQEIGLRLNNTSTYRTAFVSGRAGTQPFELGGNIGSSDLAFPGISDEVGVWRRVLTDGEQTQLYNSGAGRTYPFV